MRIADIREIAVPLKTNMRNAALRLQRDDHVRGRSRNRCDARGEGGCWLCIQLHGALCVRRANAGAVHSAHSQVGSCTLVNDSGTNFDPAKILACMMQREKPGAHTERSIAIGTIEVALGSSREDRRQATL
jgi:hypothetical protein